MSQNLKKFQNCGLVTESETGLITTIEEESKTSAIISMPVAKVVPMQIKFSGKPKRHFFSQNIFKKIIKIISLLIFIFPVIIVSAQQNHFINVNTIVIPPANPVISQYISSGNIRCTFTTLYPDYPNAYAVGRIERLSPSPFTITMNSSFRLDPALVVNMTPNVPVTLSVPQMLAAFGQFNEQVLNVQGINISAIKDANNNIKLPEGTYRICFAAANKGNNNEVTDYYSDPLLGCGTFIVPPSQPTNGVIINTQLLPPANPDIVQYISGGNVKPTLLYNNPQGAPVQVKVYGKIESLSPKPFTISLDPAYSQQPSISLSPSLPVQLSAQQVAASFANFNEGNLLTTGISLNDLKDDKNILKLPEGLYRICFYARYDSAGRPGGYASNINLGCASFNICYKAGAPQFTQPVSNFNINNNIPSVRVSSPVIFTWTPPNATCGLNLSQVTYDFEIREMFSSQTITDAINNPPVFIKTSLRSSSFLLDTLLYKQVLQRGKLYVIRVKANTQLNSPIVIDNNGYSRVQAFMYGDTLATPQIIVKQDVPKPPTHSTIATSVIKGKVVWSFKKAEEEMTPQIDNGINFQKGVMGNIGNQNPSGGADQKEQQQEAIDPNFKYTSLQTNRTIKTNNTITTTNTTTAPPPVSQVLSTVAGDGDLIEKKDLKIASENGKITHPLSGATIMLMGIKVKTNNTNSSTSGARQSQTNYQGKLSYQLGIGPSNDSKDKNSSNKYFTSIPSSYQMPEENDQEEDIIGSGTSDADGNFTINFIDPKFKNVTQYSKMRLVVSHSDFENTSQFINVVSPGQNGDVDLGTVQVVAKTYRFTPYVTGGGNQGIQMYAFGGGDKANMALYCPTETFNKNPYYTYMVGKNSDRSKKLIAGKEYIKIADLQNGETINKLFYQHGSSENFIIQITENKKETYSSYIGVYPAQYSRTSDGLAESKMNTHVPIVSGGKSSNNSLSGNSNDVDESHLVISVKMKYKLKKILPYVAGAVQISIVDKNNAANNQLFYGKGSIVTVSFDASKVVEKYIDTVYGGGSEPTENGGAKNNNPEQKNKNISQPRTKTSTNTTIYKPTNKTVNNKNNNQSTPSQTGTTSSQTGNLSSQQSLFVSTKVNATIGADVMKLFQYSTVADEEGKFRIDNLPVLQDGSFLTISVKTPDGLESSQNSGHTLKRGDSAFVNFNLRPEVYTVTGIAVDKQGNPLTNAIIKWKSGGNPIEAQPSGLFITSNYKDDYLTISNQGYVSNTIFIKLNKDNDDKKENKGKGKPKLNEKMIPGSMAINYDSKKMNEWSDLMTQQPSVKEAAKSQEGGISPAMFGYAVYNPSGNNYTAGNAAGKVSNQSSKNKNNANTKNNNIVSDTHTDNQFSTIYKDLFQPSSQPTEFNDLGKVGYLEKGFAKINFVVTDAKTKAAIGKAIITIDEVFDTTTNSIGEVLYKGGGNSFNYTVKGPDGSDYIIQSGDVATKYPDGSTTTVNVSLTHGIKLSGKITSKSKNIEDAQIFVQGKEFITTNSKADGSYSFYIPQGENTIQVTKSNYVGKSVSKTFTSASIENFDLADGGGKNISKLLGFDIELESATDNGSGQKWTGSFVNLKSNSVFSTSTNTKIKFSNVNVTFDPSGNASVSGDVVNSDVTELPLKMFGYIPVIMKGSPQITVRKGSDGKGTIGGKLQFNSDQVASIGGLLFDNTLKPLLIPQNTSVDTDIPVFTSDGSSSGLSSFVFSYARNDLKKAADKAVGDMQMKVNNAKGDGKAALQDKLNELKSAAANASSYSSGSGNIPSTLSQYASVKVFGFEAALDLSKCKINASGIDMAGFLVSPDLPILSSMLFDIDRLNVGTDFSIKDVSVKSNINLKFSIASWSAEVNSVAFNMNGFKIGGKITVQVPQSPTTDLEFSNLAFGSSGLYGGSFSMPSGGINIFNIINLQTGSTPLSFGEVGNSGIYKLGGSAKFSFAKLFSESIDVPYFQIQTDGKFGVTVPVNRSLNAGFATFALNSITFNTTTPTPQIDIDGQFSTDVKLISFAVSGIHFKSSGVTIDKIGLGIDIPGTSIDGYVEMKDNGFAGGGSLSIVGTPVKVAIDFHYYKTGSSVDLGASFVANVKIPLGPVIITKVGGGFTYRTNPDFFSVTITGGASITGFETLIALDPISITVESGPKIIGEAHVKIASSLDVAKASIIIDIPNLYFAVNIVSDIEPLPGIIKAHVQGDLIASAKPGDSYFFFGAGMDVDLLGLIKSRGVFAVGVGVNDAQTRQTISFYLQDAPSAYLNNGSFTGIYINALSEMGVKEEDAPTLDLGIVSGKLWLYNRSNFSLIADFTNANFRISADTHFEGGIQACAVDICASASAKACVGIAGGYNDSQGWNFAASASGEATLGLGSDCDCNEFCVIGAKICIGAGAKIRFASRLGGIQELSMFLGSRAQCN